MGVRTYACWDRQGVDYYDAKVVSAALGVPVETTDIVAYKMLQALYDDPSSHKDQMLGYSRYCNVSSHPFSKVLNVNVKNFSYDCGFSDIIGETYDSDHIKAFVKRVGWCEEVIPLITSLQWG